MPTRRYLLVLEGNTSAIFPLPGSGTLLVGRASTADIHVEDASVSRQHAQLTLEESEARISDLDSHNGVRVNGERSAGSRILQSGDVVTLGNVTLVFHQGERPQPVRSVPDASVLRVRLAEELERVRSYERAVSVLALELGAAPPPMDTLMGATGDVLRLMDLVGQTGNSLLVVLPELEAEEAADTARELLERLAPLVPQARAGLATAPQDGLNAEALMATAREAALAAAPGGLQINGLSLYQRSIGSESVVVADSSMVSLFELLRRLANSNLSVLIHGETGSGKENAAKAIHYWSSRASRKFMTLNCAALPESLAESQLFGYERGAFSGADKQHVGLLEESSGGTLFLDEVAELSLSIQAKLLRALDQKRITRLGENREREVDLRIVAATHRVLKEEVAAGRFRQDLFFRLSAAVVTLPPLRERPRELPLLADTFLKEACARQGCAPKQLSAATLGVLTAYPWPGNVRELKNAMEFAAVMSSGPILEPSSLPQSLRPPGAPSAEPAAPQAGPGTEPSQASPATNSAARDFRPLAEKLRELERQCIEEALEFTGGNQTRAAQLIGMPLRTLAFKLKKYKQR